MSAGWFRLDSGFYRDPKFLLMEEKSGKGACFDCVKLFSIMFDMGGRVDLNDDMQRLYLQNELGKKGKALTAFLQAAADAGIISAEVLPLGSVTSNRALKEADEHRKSLEKIEKMNAARAAKKAKEKEQQE